MGVWAPLRLSPLADDAFALKTWLMKPYPLRGKGRTYQIANYRIPRGRRVVENAFGILSQRFRVLSNTILVHPDRARVIVLACVVLHNMLRREVLVVETAGGGDCWRRSRT